MTTILLSDHKWHAVSPSIYTLDGYPIWLAYNGQAWYLAINGDYDGARPWPSRDCAAAAIRAGVFGARAIRGGSTLMNKERRKLLAAVVEKLQEAKSQLDILTEEEQGYFDNMPESFQEGEKGSIVEDCISSMGDASGEIDSVISTIEEVIGR